LTWDYVHSREIAEGYDAALAGSSLFSTDLEFARAHFSTPGRLIDLGCGTGRLMLDFACRGYSVLGVDFSEDMLRAAGAKATKAGVRVQLLKANLVELDALADASFEYAACLFSTLGMIHGAASRRRMIGHVFRLLRPDGMFLLHVHNRWFHVWDKEGRKWLFGDFIRSPLGREFAGDRPMPAHQGLAGLTLHHFTRREAVRLLTSTGFRMITVHPLSLRSDAQLRYPHWFGWLRAYGYLLVAQK
jgi:ubiquinone/menaquinone biosynthesis C-methylase UbiE